MSDKYFPIRTDTSCQLKWAWSTIFLNKGITRSCHRTSESELTEENFINFHNTPIKLADRKDMLEGKWPEKNCSYCREIENIGGVSDRMRQMTIPNLTPVELETDPTATVISPSIVEVYFNNACNLGCLYCDASFSSTIETENKNFGEFKSYGVEIIPTFNHFKDLVPYFWQWFPEGFVKIKRFHILGGEPFFQKEFDKLLDMIEKNPNPNCELNIVTNLMVPKIRIEEFVDRFKKLLTARKLKRIDITCSIDCWGDEQEYVRWGLKLDLWEENFKLLLDNKWLYLNINQTISALTIKTMPTLLSKLADWRKDRQIGHWFSSVTPGPSYLKGEIFGTEEFADTVEEILKLMPMTTEEDKSAYQYMNGILKRILATEQNLEEITKLLVYLNEKDRRRNTDWRQIFSWLIKYEALCGIQK
jgi:sulfatase maturation enzyme AslB (radical SAM superfamily)